MKKTELLALLLHNVALEHSAIVQYLYQVFLIRDPGIREEIEKIAREEMRHLKWFAQKVVQIGGEVEIKRVEEAIDLSRETLKGMIEADISAEELAIKTYTQQLETVRDDSVRRLLERVIGDEESHKGEFEELLRNAEEEKINRGSDSADQKTTSVLNELFREEYAIILKYLKAFFHSKNWEHRDLMLDLAVESMVHMGDLGEKIGELGGRPDFTPADLGDAEGLTLPDQIMENILYEQTSGEKYLREGEITEREDIKRLLSKIHHQERYHHTRLRELS
ncbi:MAG: ferritin-like domain-containing protein [Aquificota bacterium]|nr:ferritin-like domain-containing protein [Aquificota bacterium]